MATDAPCFHHSDRLTGRKCTRCERFACPECLHSASVGSQCWQCIKAAQPPLKERIRRKNATAGPVITNGLIIANILIFAVSFFSSTSIDINRELGLFGPLVAEGEWYRLISSGFIHFGIFHVLSNLILLYQLGMLLESELGRSRYIALYVASLLGGAFGALLLSPLALTGGASGAVFGLAGAALIGMHRSGVGVMQSGIGVLVAFNLVATFVIPNISIGGHLGGLAAGVLVGLIVFRSDPRCRPVLVDLVAIGALIAALAVGSVFIVA